MEHTTVKPSEDLHSLRHRTCCPFSMGSMLAWLRPVVSTSALQKVSWTTLAFSCKHGLDNLANRWYFIPSVKYYCQVHSSEPDDGTGVETGRDGSAARRRRTLVARCPEEPNGETGHQPRWPVLCWRWYEQAVPLRARLRDGLDGKRRDPGRGCHRGGSRTRRALATDPDFSESDG